MWSCWQCSLSDVCVNFSSSFSSFLPVWKHLFSLSQTLVVNQRVRANHTQRPTERGGIFSISVSLGHHYCVNIGIHSTQVQTHKRLQLPLIIINLKLVSINSEILQCHSHNKVLKLFCVYLSYSDKNMKLPPSNNLQ